jgi:hypothetical protein
MRYILFLVIIGGILYFPLKYLSVIIKYLKKKEERIYKGFKKKLEKNKPLKKI